MTLEEYFHAINKLKQKEPNMFERSVERSKAYFQSLKDSWSSLYKWDVEITDKPVQEDYWAFEMYTGEWVDENEIKHPDIDTCIIHPNSFSWIEVLETVIGELEKHYGYNIREQVYYAVKLPLNHEDFGAQGRELNDEVLQQLLLAFPEVYERNKVWDQPANVFGE